MNTESQTRTILRVLMSGGRITPLEALMQHGCFRLAARIADLRRDGWPIKMERVEHEGKHFAEYFLPSSEDGANKV